ncbi:hypothetical protein WJX77_011368 [Trebouxia sp. C0004]
MLYIQRASAQKHRSEPAIRSAKRHQCDIIRWTPDEDGPFSEGAGHPKTRKLVMTYSPSLASTGKLSLMTW